jgi:ATP/maltotriose-dependent transcriptional regulator MalT
MLDELVGEVVTGPTDCFWLASMAQLAAVSAAWDDSRSARRLYAALLPLRGQWVAASSGSACYGPISRLLGLLATTFGDRGAAHEHFSNAYTEACAMRSAPWTAHALFGRARCRVATDPAAALSDFAESIKIAEGLGMTVLAAQARREAGKLRVRTSAEQLTHRERQVAELVQRGMSTHRIAQHLTISERTVETHIANIYGKLGIHSRSALVRRVRVSA